MIHTITSSNENVTSPHVVGAVHDPPRLSAPSSYALVPAGPEVPAAEVELPNVDAIEVLVLWGTNVLHVAHRAITQGFFVGDASRAEPCDFVLPPDVLGTPRLPLVLGSGAGPDGVEAPARLVEIGAHPCVVFDNGVWANKGGKLRNDVGAGERHG